MPSGPFAIACARALSGLFPPARRSNSAWPSSICGTTVSGSRRLHWVFEEEVVLQALGDEDEARGPSPSRVAIRTAAGSSAFILRPPLCRSSLVSGERYPLPGRCQLRAARHERREGIDRGAAHADLEMEVRARRVPRGADEADQDPCATVSPSRTPIRSRCA